MEIILAIVVASAVIFFGALISMGNERQKKAIDSLREQVTLWAIQDLKIKREHLKQSVQVSDPVGWLNKIASAICTYDLQLQVTEIYEEPQSLICISGNNSTKIIFSPMSPSDLRRYKNGSRNISNRLNKPNPFLFLPKNVKTQELSILNNTFLFDLEFALVWKKITNQNFDTRNNVWIYIITND